LDDSFRIASVTKTFTAVLTVQLAGEGRLQLDDTVAHWLPGLLAHGRDITIAELLQHTSGLPDYVKDSAFLAKLGADLKRRWYPRRVIAFVADQRLEFRPGSEYDYSDTDNLVLGLLVKRVTHGSYAQALRRRILRPLGMHDTFLARNTSLPRPFVHGYQFDDGNGKGRLLDFTHAVSPSAAWASGAMVSTLSDLSRFWRALLGGRLVRPGLLRQMLSHTLAGGGSPLGPGDNRAGLGIFAWSMKCGTLYGHTGSFPGYQTFSGATRDGSASVVVLANATQASSKGARRQTKAYREAACEAIRAAH
jgi:D-alanyl-D-alanine carboxypeptidase